MRALRSHVVSIMLRLGSGTLLAAVLVGIAACVSERTTVTGVDASACNVALPAAGFGSAVVVIRNFAFSPASIRVRPGTKVTWVNCEAAGTDSHTSTADGAKWTSPVLASGATYTTELGTAGSFAYHCELHPGMKGSVIVE